MSILWIRGTLGKGDPKPVQVRSRSIDILRSLQVLEATVRQASQRCGHDLPSRTCAVSRQHAVARAIGDGAQCPANPTEHPLVLGLSVFDPLCKAKTFVTVSGATPNESYDKRKVTQTGEFHKGSYACLCSDDGVTNYGSLSLSSLRSTDFLVNF